MQNETQTASFRTWTHVDDSISWDDNRYAKLFIVYTNAILSNLLEVIFLIKTNDSVYVYSTPPVTGCNTRLIFKWSTAGLSSEFSFP